MIAIGGSRSRIHSTLSKMLVNDHSDLRHSGAMSKLEVVQAGSPSQSPAPFLADLLASATC